MKLGNIEQKKDSGEIEQGGDGKGKASCVELPVSFFLHNTGDICVNMRKKVNFDGMEKYSVTLI